MDSAPPPPPAAGSSGSAGPSKGPSDAVPRRRRWVATAVFFAVLLLALILHRCQTEPPPPATLAPPSGPARPAAPEPPAPKPESLPVAPAPKPIKPAVPKPKRSDSAFAKPPDSAKARVLAPPDSGPYLWADPWGGRHFDSVRVTLHCRQGCVVLFSLTDSVNFKSYEDTLVFKRNTRLWISGIDSLGRQAPPIRVDYVIERNPGDCAGETVPITSATGSVCMDKYEWPDSEGSVPRAFVNHKEAEDSCRSVGKRLCTEAEWKAACQGPDQDAYPYGARYRENDCPAKEAAAARSGRFPVCRSYYGVYDMAGNLWEWTSTPASDPDFFMVAGGNWTTGNEATCRLAKFSFYPAVRYPFVGFRCCQEPSKGKGASKGP
jgi:hypothetical protein